MHKYDIITFPIRETVLSWKNRNRKPRNYDGIDLTSQPVAQILPRVLGKIGATYKQRPDLILAAWPELVGERLAPMTQAMSFVDGVLTVRVKNSTLHSLLNTKDKARILRSLREKFPQTTIKNVLFKLG